MTGKTVGTMTIALGVLVAILTIHIWTIIAVGLILGGSGVRAVSGSNRGALTAKARKSLL